MTEPIEHPIRVLIADDTTDFRLLLRINLEIDGRFDIVGEAKNGAEAVTMAGAQHPDVVILDLAMPVMDGLQAAELIHRSSSGTKIVVLTGFGGSSVAEKAFAAGADKFLEKGISLDQLVAEVVAVVADEGVSH